MKREEQPASPSQDSPAKRLRRSTRRTNIKQEEDTILATPPLTQTSVKEEPKDEADSLLLAVKHEDQDKKLLAPELNLAEETDRKDDDTMVGRRKPPAGWKALYDGIKAHRTVLHAPVDDMGCAELADADAPLNVFRYQTLTSLQLSSQTKDPVTAEAIRNLRAHKPGGLTVDSILAMDNKTLNGYIGKVGFHNRKTIYLKQTAQILKDKYNSDIPSTVEELMSLPGVGPKMAYLAMQHAHGQNMGIGVDTHVHRISNRLGWAHTATKTPEHTRKELEEWLPREYWQDINHLLVGWGQTVCQPVRPKCSECPVRDLCPKIGTKSKQTVK
eukprot:jgi/Hompol1/1415/HPOL_004718-RA